MGKHSYIAAQAPLPITFEAFFRMIWDINTRVVIMLTKLVEKGKVEMTPFLFFHFNQICFCVKVKAHDYLPPLNQSVTYGRITVTTEEEEVHQLFVLKKITLTLVIPIFRI